MITSAVPLVPSLELDIIRAYLEGGDASHLEPLFDAMNIRVCVEVPRISIAVAQILLYDRQDELPQWGVAYADGDVVLAREPFEQACKGPAARLQPKLVCCINWADSGPGYSWPESYRVTSIPGFDKHIVAASRDSTDRWGCTDHALGFRDAVLAPEEAARQVVTQFWRGMYDEYGQAPWVRLFDEGLIDVAEADRWAASVWGARHRWE